MVWPGVGAQVASLRCPTLRPGPNSVNQNINPASKMSLPIRKCLRNYAAQGITDLVLSSATSLAGFEVSTYGRFSGVHRGRTIKSSSLDRNSFRIGDVFDLLYPTTRSIVGTSPL